MFMFARAPARLLAPAARMASSWGMRPPEELVADAVRGDAEAMRSLLAMLGPHLLRTVRRIVLVRADAEDAAQEAMAAVVRDLPTLRDQQAVVAFATRIAARVAWRARAKMRREEAGRTAFAALGDDAEAASPAHEVAARERAERLLRALERIPDEQAEAIVLQHVLGMQPAEVAAAMDVPVNTVRSRVRLARIALARKLVNDPVVVEARKESST